MTPETTSELYKIAVAIITRLQVDEDPKEWVCTKVGVKTLRKIRQKAIAQNESLREIARRLKSVIDKEHMNKLKVYE